MSKRYNTKFERHVAAQLLRLLGLSLGKPKQQDGRRAMYAVLGNLLTSADEGSDQLEVRAQCIRFCESKKEAENCDLGGDFEDSDVSVFDLEDEAELKDFLSSVTPQSDYTSFFIQDGASKDEEE